MDIAALGLRVEGIQELERLLAAMEKLEKQQGQTEKSQNGLNEQQKQSKKPLEDSKKATEQLTEAERRLAEQARKAGMSVNELKNNLRGLPAQFTDIAVSLQGGQAPLTVFLQQGGQLKDMFNGAGNAARAMGGYVTSLISPLSLAATAVTVLGVAYYQGSKEADAFRVSLATTGNTIGTTTDALTIYSRQIAEAGETQGKAAESLNVFVAAGFKSEEQLAQFTRTAIAWERATGEGVDSVAEKFVALEKDPLKAAMKLQESMNFLTVDIYKQIKALEDQGDKLGAAALAMGAYDAAMAKSTQTILENMGYLEYSAHVVTRGFKGMWDIVAGIGRPDPKTDQLAEAYERLNNIVLAGVETTPAGQAAAEKQREVIKTLEAGIAATKAKTEADKQSAIAVKELSAFDAKYSDALKDKLTLEQTLANARKEALSVGKSEADITKILAYETEKYNKANKTRAVSTKAIENSYRTLAERAAEYVKSLQLEAQQGVKISKSQQLEIELQSLLVRGKGKGTDAAVKQTKALIAEAKAMETQAKARKAMAEAAEQYQKDLEEIAEYQQKESEAVAKQAQATYESGKALENESRMLELQAGLIGASTQARELAIEQLRIQIELEKELDALDNDKALPSDKREEAKAKARERAVQRGANAEKKILIDSYNEIGKYVEDALYDAIVTGGASAGEALERMFKNLVLQPIVKAGVQSLMGAVGLGGGGGSGNLLSTGKSVYDAFNSPLFSDFGSGLAGQIQQVGGTMFANGMETFGSSVVDFGNTVAQYADTINLAGDVLGYGKAIFAATEGDWGNAVGTAVGTYFGGPIGAAIGSTLGGLVDGVFGGGSTPHAGAASQYTGGQITAGGKQFTRSAINADYTAGLQSSVDSLAFTLGSTLDGLDKIFGGQGGFSVTTGFKADSDDPSNATLQISNAVGDTLVKWLAQRSGEFGSRKTGQSYDSDPAQGFDEYLKAITAATIPQFKAIVPAWADAMLDSFGQSIGFSGNASDWESISASGADAMQALQQVAAQIAQVEQAFASLSETLPMFADISDDFKSALMGAFGGIEGVANAASAYYQNYFDEQERYEASLEKMRATLSSIGASLDPAAENAKAAFRSAVEGAFAAGNEALSAQLLALGGSFSELAEYAEKSAEATREAAMAQEKAARAAAEATQAAAEAAEEAARAATEAAIAAAEAAEEARIAQLEIDRKAREDFAASSTAALSSMTNTAWKNLEASIDRQRDKWTKVSSAASEAVSEIGGILNTLTSNATNLYGTISAASQMQAVQGSLYIESALAAVRNGQSVRSFGGLSSAIDAARGGLDAGNFSTAFDQQRETQRLANQLGDLGSYADEQLTVEEKALETARQQLEQLNKTSEYWAAQLDIGATQIDATLSVAQAVAKLGSLLPGLNSASKASNNQDYFSSKLSQLQRENPNFNGVDWTKADTNDLRAYFTASGLTPMQHWERFGKDEGLAMPSFDVGTNYVPHDMVAKIHEGEAIVPKQYNPAAGGSLNSGVETMLSQLISDNRAQASSIIKLQSTMARIIERWNLDGLPQPRDEARV